MSREFSTLLQGTMSREQNKKIDLQIQSISTFELCLDIHYDFSRYSNVKKNEKVP